MSTSSSPATANTTRRPVLIVLFAALAGTLPLLASTLIAGTAVDYIGRRRVSMIADGLSGLSVVAVPVILALCAVVGLVYGPIAPIYNYVMPSLRELDRAPDSRDRAMSASAITDLAAQLTEGSVATDPDIMASSRQRGAADPDACLHGQAQFPGRLGL